MIQLNLLPDVKLEYIKAQRERRLFISISVLTTMAAILILIFIFGYGLAQQKHLKDLNNDINKESSALQNKPDIGKILTVQNQLQSLTSLHAAKPAASRLFDTYINEITPANVAISSLQIDFTQHTIAIQGTADSLTTINQYVDTLKFTTYTYSGSNQTNAFSNVVLGSYSLNSNATSANQAASYSISLNFDSNIFDITKNVTLSVPSLITTRSELEQPADLFKTQPTTGPSSGGNH